MQLKSFTDFNYFDPFDNYKDIKDAYLEKRPTESIGNIVFWHGSTDKNFSGKKGIHIGSREAAKQALEARIGIPAEGEWDGTRVYGKTLLAGKKTLKEKNLSEAGYNCSGIYDDVPEEDYYPTEREFRARYSDGSPVPFESKPIIFPVKIISPYKTMTNSPYDPHSDQMANSLMMRQLRQGKAKRGYYYVNIGEDVGSLSAVVPDGTFLKIVN